MTDRGMNDDQIERVFGALARIEEKQDSVAQYIQTHAVEHKEINEEISKIKLAAARQRGWIAGVTGVGSLLGAAAGYAIDIFSKAHK